MDFIILFFSLVVGIHWYINRYLLFIQSIYMLGAEACTRTHTHCISRNCCSLITLSTIKMGIVDCEELETESSLKAWAPPGEISHHKNLLPPSASAFYYCLMNHP